MFQIKYSVLNVECLTAHQLALYERWQTITEETLTRIYGPREQRGNTLGMETDAEAIAREAYEDSLLEPEDRLQLRIGHFAEDYWRSLGEPEADCNGVVEDECIKGWEDITGSDGQLFNCWLDSRGYKCNAKVLYLPGTDSLEIIQSSTDWEPEKD